MRVSLDSPSPVIADLASPRLGITPTLAAALRLAYPLRSNYRSEQYWTTYTPRGDKDKYESLPPGALYFLSDLAVTIRSEDSGSFASDFLERYLEALPIEQAHSFRNLLLAVMPSANILADSFLNKAGAFVGAYAPNNGRVKGSQLFFDWVFYNIDCSDFGTYGYTGHVYYDLANIPAVLDLVRQTLLKEGADEPYTRAVLEKLARFEGSPSHAALQAFAGRGRGHKEKFHDSGSWGPGEMMARQSYGVGSRGLRNGYREENDLLSQFKEKVTGADPAAVRAFRSALRDFEYLLTWARFYDKMKVPYCTPVIGPEVSELRIENGRNLALVVAPEKDEHYQWHLADREVVPNSICFSPERHNICLSGANGGGKTHLLEMISNATLMAHRGLLPLAKAMSAPVMGVLEHGVNNAIHSETSSAFQNWVLYLKDLITRVEATPGERGLVLLDEPGRGTDAKDGIPIIIALMKYFQRRGIYFGFSTHFNGITQYADLMTALGITTAFYTMDRKAHTLVEGSGRSDGLAVAAELGWDPEVIAMARQVEAAPADGTIHIEFPARASIAPASGSFGTLSEKDLIEMGIYALKRDSEWGDYRQLGELTRIYARYSPFSRSEFDSSEKGTEFDDYVPALRPDAAEVFCGLYTQPLDTPARAERVGTLAALLENHGAPSTRLTGILGKFKNYRTLFAIYQEHKKKGIEGVLDLMMVGLAGGDIQKEKNDYQDFARDVKDVPIPLALESLQALVENFDIQSFPAMQTQLNKIRAFLASPACAQMRDFWAKINVHQDERALRLDSSYENIDAIVKVIGEDTFRAAVTEAVGVDVSGWRDLEGIKWSLNYSEDDKWVGSFLKLMLLLSKKTGAKFKTLRASRFYKREYEQKLKNRSAAESLTMDKWKDWVNLCVEHKDELLELHMMLLGLNFYGTVSQTIHSEFYSQPYWHAGNAVEFNGVKNAGLLARAHAIRDRYKAERGRGYGQPQLSESDFKTIVASDIQLSFERPLVIISGTNGGGKTKALATMAGTLYDARQIGYVQAIGATLPEDLQFVSFSVTTAEHTDGLSSWQNEVLKIKHIIDSYKAAGEPGRGVVFLDEPGKGTSGEEAIPLLIGLVKYFERRGVMVVMTTHFSNIYEYLERLETASAITHQSLHMDFFAEGGQRYVLQPGIGQSEGVRVAEHMGVPAEIIETAKAVAAFMNT